MKDNCFFPLSIYEDTPIPSHLNDPFDIEIPQICKVAVDQLQEFLTREQSNWKHNFGLTENKTGTVKGKMFGVLVVENKSGELGFICTYSGKLDDEPDPSFFVPSVFDITRKDHFLTKGMTELSLISERIEALEKENHSSSIIKANGLRALRKNKSLHLQEEIFEQYHFLNIFGKTKSLNDIFNDLLCRKPAAGAGECAAPKLLHLAFKNGMKPLAIGEFWWGASTRGQDKKHGHFYPACNDKCRPILSWMLDR